MAPLEASHQLGSATAIAAFQNQSAPAILMTTGWMQQPNGRGTWDIIQTCVVTVVLCSWSSLCLNVSRGKGRHSLWRNKLRWMFFTIFWPEVTLGAAFEQWESAHQCVKEFYQLGCPQWTMRHAFLADMGGFLLNSPDFSPFPVDGHQLAFLIREQYVPYPDKVDPEYIWDKNKADGFTRAITLLQIAWFSINCIGRAAQHLTISTLEVLTITFIYCSLFSFFCWAQKPVDVQTPINLYTDTPIATILVKAGDVAKQPYKLTPLDFLVHPPTKTNFVATWWWGVELCFNGIFFEIGEKVRPATTFANSRTHPPRGYTTITLLARLTVAFGYFLLHFAGWNLTLPTAIEQKLWRAAIGWFLAEYSLYILVFAFVSSLSTLIAKKFFNAEATTFIEVANLYPLWFRRACLVPIYGSYGVIRIYIVVEGFISLRSVPPDVYSSVNWSGFLPHL